MVVNIAALAVAGFITYMWVIRGFFSALIHLVCTIIAGALAFAVWEPLSYMLLESAPTGFFSWVGGMAWAVGLLVPFALILTILRVAVDQMLPANVVLSSKFNYIGGGVCGLCSGVLSGGMLAIGMGFFRADDAFGKPVVFQNGTYVSNKSMWVPLDRITSDFYGLLSEHAFSTGEPLAKWHPAVFEEGRAMGISAFEGKDRNTMRLADFSVDARFTVGDDKSTLSKLIGDKWRPGQIPKSAMMDGSPFPANSHIEGFLVKFKPGAKEKDGKVAIGQAQVRLVLENSSDGKRMSVFPIAVTTKVLPATPPPGATPPPAGAAPIPDDEYARWLFDSDGTFIGSVGGSADAVFAFEFVCAPGYQPIALYIKGARHEVNSPATATPKIKFFGAADRDAALTRLEAGFGVAMTKVTSVDTSLAIKAPIPTGEGVSAGSPPFGFRMSYSTPFTIQKGTHDNLELDEENDKNIIISGDATLPLDALQNKGLEKAIRIDKFLTTPDTVMVQIDAGAGTAFSVTTQIFINQTTSSPPCLFDTNNTVYIPVGYIYQDETKILVSFKPGDPVTSMEKLPKMSASRPAQKLTLLYRVTRGAAVNAFGINAGAAGAKASVIIDPPYTVNQAQGR